MIHELHELLQRAGARLRSLRLASSLAVCWIAWALVVYGVARWGADGAHNWPAVWGALAAAAVGTALVCWFATRRCGRDPRRVARQIEAAHPELGALLLAALDEAPTPKFRRLGYLQARVVRGAVTHGRAHNWANAASRSRLWLARTAQLAALAALLSASFMLVDRTRARASAAADPRADGASLMGGEYRVQIHPGDAEIERGTTLLVIARFQGPLPPDADLVVQRAPQAARDADEETVRGMTRSLDDPQFVGRVPAVTGDLAYYVEFAGQRTRSYRVAVFDYPDLVRADAQLTFPDYARLEPKLVEDVRQVTAVEGTQLVLTFRLNKDVAAATLVDRAGEEVVLRRAAGEDPAYEARFTLRQSQRFKLHLVDRQQRRNKLPPEFVVNVTPNAPPVIKIDRPGRDVRVSPVEELQLAGEVADDFGVTAYGVSYALGGEEPRDVVLGSPAPPTPPAAAEPVKQQQLAHLIDFESLAAEPDQLVSYYVWAEDVGPDGQPRRTLSDMYFAEVRHFDEIFREGEQPTERQQQEQQQAQQDAAGQQAEQLAELQKQIVNATWNLIRRETGATPTAKFADDAAAVAEAQQQALQQLDELVEQLADEEARQFAASAREEMEAARESLAAAAQSPDLGPLRGALPREQAAYQALLKLRARQFNVTRNAGQLGPAGTTSGAGSASQRQLQQLELSADENRYETQSRAASQARQNAEQLNQSRQILNRLRDLARRQQDLNQRLRELQSALAAADSPAEREELERQLKRLRDQQREILRDAESLDNDLQNSENRQQLEDAAEQLDRTRSRVQDATAALDDGEISQAIAEGARAERELSDLRDDFRRQTADRFTEEMTELRDAARRLDERQRRLAQQLDELNARERQSLRNAAPRQEMLAGLDEQRRELDDVLDRMRATVAEAEEPEPLLAQELYDAVQQAGDQRLAEALELARELTEAGVASEAGEAMRQAGRGVEELRRRVDRAAESVLGDETEALRRAEQRLRELGEALDREIDQARGEGESRPADSGEPAAGEAGDAPSTDEPGAPSEEPPPAAGDQPGAAPGESPAGNRPPQNGAGRRGGGQPPAAGDTGAPRDEFAGPAGQAEQPGANPDAREGDAAAGGENPTPDDGADQPGGAGRPAGQRPAGGARRGGNNNGGGGPGGLDRLDEIADLFAGGVRAGGPITGDDFREWAEGLREVEDMLDDADLSAEAARIRDRAELARAEFKRHARTPDWDALIENVAEPLVELRTRIAAEIRRKTSPDDLVPIDRDEAPAEFADDVRFYYEQLGSGE